MPSPLPTTELYPAGTPGVTSRMAELSTGVTVRIAEAGPADGVPTLLLHGWGGSLYMYRHAMERLPAYGIRAIAVDLRGYGLSGKPMRRGAYTLDAYCNDLDALLAALELRRVALVGQSMGGGVALHYALRHPDRVTRLALISPVGLVRIAYPAFAGMTPRLLTGFGGRRIVPRPVVGFILRRIAYGDPSHVTQRDVDEYWAPTQLPGYVYAAHGCLREFEWRPITAVEAAALEPRTLVVLGTADRLVRRAGAAARRLRESEVHEVEGGGHCVHEEQPDLVYGLIGAHVR